MATPINLEDYVFSELMFTKDGNNLEITTDGVATHVLTVTDFFVDADPATEIYAKDDEGAVIQFTFENDVIITLTGDENNVFDGTAYNDEMLATRYNHTINPGAGNDLIYSNSKKDGEAVTVNNSAGNDAYYSGEGRDIFISGTGHNTFVFAKELGGKDIIQASSGNDKISFDDVRFDELSFSKVNSDLAIFYGDSYILVKDYYDNNGAAKVDAIDRIVVIDEVGEAVNKSILLDASISDNYFDTTDFDALTFKKEGDVLHVELGENGKYYDDFFTTKPVEYILTKAENGDIIRNSIKKEALIEVKVNGANDYDGTDYNEDIYAQEAQTFEDVSITAGKGNDVINLNSEDSATLIFRHGDGQDEISGATSISSIKFVQADGVQVTYDDLDFTSNDHDLIIRYGNDSITISDYDQAESPIDDIEDSVGGIWTINSSLDYVDNCYFEEDFNKGKLTVTQASKIVAKDYLTDKAKGVTITSKSTTSNDYLVGSYYNDKVTAKGGNNYVKEIGGKNTITTGNGNDNIELLGTSSNTVKAGNGVNFIGVYSVGTNKITGGKDNDVVDITAGNNTVNLKAGQNAVGITGGINKVTTGKQADSFVIDGGNNIIKSGAGDDTFNIMGTGAHGDIATTVTAGKGDHTVIVRDGLNSFKFGASVTKNTITINGGVNSFDVSKATSDFTINDGTNIIKGGKGDDSYSIANGRTFITDKKGNDTYNFRAADYDNVIVTVDDTKGKNEYEFYKDIYDKNVYFEVNLAKKHKTDADGDYKYSTGKSVLFTTFGDGNIADTGIEMVMDKKNQVGTITFYDDMYEDLGDNSYRLAIDEVAQSVANWLGAQELYDSTTDVLASGDTNAINEMLAIYGTVSNCLDTPV